MSINPKFIIVSDVMLSNDKFPIMSNDNLVSETLRNMSKYSLGIACIINNQNELLAVFTDGDIRRTLLNSHKPIGSFFMDDVMDYATKNVKFVHPSQTLKEAVEMMGRDKIWDLPVVDSKNHLLGLLHLHPALEAVLQQGY